MRSLPLCLKTTNWANVDSSTNRSPTMIMSQDGITSDEEQDDHDETSDRQSERGTTWSRRTGEGSSKTDLLAAVSIRILLLPLTPPVSVSLASIVLCLCQLSSRFPMLAVFKIPTRVCVSCRQDFCTLAGGKKAGSKFHCAASWPCQKTNSLRYSGLENYFCAVLSRPSEGGLK